MSSDKQIMTVLGFLKQNDATFPSRLKTVVTVDGDADTSAVYSIDSEGNLERIMSDAKPTKAAKLDKVTSRPSFIAAAKDTPIQSSDAKLLPAFAFAANDIVVGDTTQILQRVSLAIDCDQFSGTELTRLEDEQEALQISLERRQPRLERI